MHVTLKVLRTLLHNLMGQFVVRGIIGSHLPRRCLQMTPEGGGGHPSTASLQAPILSLQLLIMSLQLWQVGLTGFSVVSTGLSLSWGAFLPRQVLWMMSKLLATHYELREFSSSIAYFRLEWLRMQSICKQKFIKHIMGITESNYEFRITSFTTYSVHLEYWLQLPWIQQRRRATK